jgi:hypothetical protein
MGRSLVAKLAAFVGVIVLVASQTASAITAPPGRVVRPVPPGAGRAFTVSTPRTRCFEPGAAVPVSVRGVSPGSSVTIRSGGVSEKRSADGRGRLTATIIARELRHGERFAVETILVQAEVHGVRGGEPGAYLLGTKRACRALAHGG